MRLVIKVYSLYQVYVYLHPSDVNKRTSGTVYLHQSNVNKQYILFHYLFLYFFIDDNKKKLIYNCIEIPIIIDINQEKKQQTNKQT